MSVQQNSTSLFPKDFNWRRPFGSQKSGKSGSTIQQALSSGSTNNQLAARSRSPFRRRPKSSISSIPAVASPALPAAIPTPSVLSGGRSRAGAVAPTVLTAAPLLLAPPAASVPLGGGPGVGAVAPTNSLSLWERSLEITQKKLLEKGLPPLALSKDSHQPASEIVKLTIDDLQATIGDQQHDKSVAAQRLQDILRTFDKYAKIVDTAIQHSPEVTALVWAGVRGILQVALNHMGIIESLEQVTATIVEKMALCDFYASMYEETSKIILSSAATTQQLQKTLGSALPELYAAILVFAVKARQYFDIDPSITRITKLAYMFKPFAVEFQPFIDDISEQERRVRECADMGTMKRIIDNSRTLEQMQGLLNNIELKVAPLTKLNEIFDITKLRRIRELLQMLSPLESPKRHQDVRSSRVEGTGAWVLQHDRFCQWRDSTTQNANDRILCCYGAPGAGKTVISSIVIDDLTSQFPRRNIVGIAYLYCDYRDQASQTVVNILGSLLQQFLIPVSQVPDAVTRSLESIQQEHKRVEIKDISEMIKIIVPLFDRSFVCIDALDELEFNIQKHLLEVLHSEFSTSRIFLTGRPHVQLALNTYLGLNPEQQRPIDVIADPSDIGAYINRAIAQDTNPDAMNGQLKADILSTIIEKSQGMFLLPVLHIGMVLDQQTITKRREALKELPVDLHKAFADMIHRVASRPSAQLGLRALMWLHLAHRPLKLDEFSHLLAVERGDTKMHKDNIPSKKALLESCVGLVIFDEETEVVRFVHYSVEEYIKQRTDFYFPTGYTEAAEICLTYLNFDEVACHCTTMDSLEQQMEDFAFLEYAACYWGHYARYRQSNDSVRRLALKLLQWGEKEPHCAFQVLRYKYLWRTCCPWSKPFTRRFMGIHAAASFGLELYMTSLVNGAEDWNLRDEDDHTPLIWAVMAGREAVVKLLVGQEDVDINPKDKKFTYTPLSWAVKSGSKAMVKLLLDCKRVDVDSRDNSYHRTALSRAAEYGHEDIVRLFIERPDVNADLVEYTYTQTPLSRAADNGQEAVVRLLLEREDVDADGKHSDRSPLSRAAENGHEAIVRLLLERDDVNPDSKDPWNWTPLLFAVNNGHEAVVRLLLERKEVNVNIRGTKWGSPTPLGLAIENKHEAIVRLLLEHKDVDASLLVWNRPGWTPLREAAIAGNEAIMRLLMEREDVDIDSRDEDDRTPFNWAAKKGHEAIVRLLIECDGVDVNSRDNNGMTPLSWAAQCGHKGVVKLLIEHDGVDVNSKDNKGMTPLSWAASGYQGITITEEHEAIVKLLIECERVDVNSKDNDGMTPLSWAAMRGFATKDGSVDWKRKGWDAIVKLLVECERVDVNLKNNKGMTPLSLAADIGYEAAVKLLIECERVDVSSKDNEGMTSLHWAAMRGLTTKEEIVDYTYREGWEAIVKLLIECERVDVNSKDNKGRTPLSLAADYGHEAIVKLLLECQRVDVNSMDNEGMTPLSWAAMRGLKTKISRYEVVCNGWNTKNKEREGWEAIVKLLIECERVDVNSKDHNGVTPLSLAGECGSRAIVKLLIECERVDVKAQ